MPDAANTIATEALPGDSDLHLLRRFVDKKDQDAFNRLVARHLDRVYATARRFVGDTSLADDVTQAVFIVLLSKAKTLRENTVLLAWLHRVTFLTSRTALRSRRHQLIHERRAAQMNPTTFTRAPAEESGAASTEQLAALDVALAALNDSDRGAVVLRFFQNKPFSEVGAVLGISEVAASKRVSRAVNKLRGLLLRRGVRAASTDIPRMLSQAPPPPPPTLLPYVALGASKGLASAGAGAVIAGQVIAIAMWTKVKLAAIGIAALLIVGTAVTLVIMYIGRSSSPGPAPSSVQHPPVIAHSEGPIAPDSIQYKAIAVHDPALEGFPYAPGWPVALPGEITGTPVVADLLGDGKLEVVVPCFARDASVSHVHPSPNPLLLLFAFRLDGTALPGWPVIFSNKKAAANKWGGWASSPSVYRSNGKDNLVLVVDRVGCMVISGNRTTQRVGSGDRCVSAPLADIDGDGVMDIVMGKALTNVQGRAPRGWPPSKLLHNGYGPCIGDAAGDGKPLLFHLFYTTPNTPYVDLAGFDAQGNRLPGWPHKIDDPSWFGPVMGDVRGTGKMDIIGAYGQHVFAFDYLGNPLPNTTTEGPLVGILKSGVSALTATAALADLDGDGKAEIIIFDERAHELRAWHGDGTGLDGKTHSSATTPSSADAVQPMITNVPAEVRDVAALDPADGLIASLPNAEAHGVSVVSLGNDPRVMDFFTGTYWIRRFPDGKTTIINMIPSDVSIEWTQPTIADVEGSGQADVIFGLSDGRVFIYRTGLAYHADRMQWPTANGNFQHTGAWRPTAKAKGDG